MRIRDLGLWQDVKYGTRMLRRNAGFTSAAVLCLALGIGPSVAMFSLLSALLFRPLPYPEAERLVQIARQARNGTAAGPASWEEFNRLQNESRAVQPLVGRSFLPVTLNTGRASEMVQSEMVSAAYFHLLGIEALYGRTFVLEETAFLGQGTVAVLSHRLWQRSFAGDVGVIGATIRINGHAVTVIGVAPEGFTGMTPMIASDLWLPISLQVPLIAATDTPEVRSTAWLGVVGRLTAGMAPSMAAAELAGLRIGPDADQDGEAVMWKVSPFRGIGIPLHARGSALRWSTVLVAVVILVLLVACSNIANLLLARAQARTAEIGVRLALGAGRARLIRQLLIENLQLALLGGVVGFMLALFLVRIFYLSQPRVPGYILFTLDVAPDAGVTGLALLLTLATSLIFGLVPALIATRPELVDAVRGGLGTSGGRKSRLRHLLVVAQVTVSMVLLVAAGLLVRTLLRSLDVDPGFSPEGVLAMRLNLDHHRDDEEQGRKFLAQLLEEVGAVAGVQQVNLSDRLPLSGYRRLVTVQPTGHRGRDTGASQQVEEVVISPGHFSLLTAELLLGRDFAVGDDDAAERVAIVSRTMAHRLWPTGSPIGQTLWLDGENSHEVRIVGLVEDIRYGSLQTELEGVLYRPVGQAYAVEMSLLARVAGKPEQWMPALREAVRTIDPELAITDLLTLEEQIDASLLQQRSVVILFSLAGVMGLMLASCGLYGVMSYNVRLRRREIGVRMALGARSADVVQLVLRHGLTLVAVGIGCGLILASLTSRALIRVLAGTHPLDPLTYAVVIVIFVLTACLACLIPARMASRIVPWESLRTE